MAKREPFTWNPQDVVELKNVSGQNILLDLPSGLHRLDKDRTTRIVASALKLPQVKALLDNGQITAQNYKWR